jgi:8-oxo-dGTP diphosphatase
MPKGPDRLDPNESPPTPNTQHPTPTGLDLRTVVVLFHGGRLLLLQRASWKKFAPNRWTGLGGKVEPAEIADLVGAARREVFEETDLTAAEMSELRVRRVLLFHHPDEGLVSLVYLTGETRTDRVPACNEGALCWVAPEELAGLDVIENTARVLPLLIEDVRLGRSEVRCGVAQYDERGRLQTIVFEDGHLA